MTDLPTGWRRRRPTLDDTSALLALVHASDIVAVGFPDYSVEDVTEALVGPNADPTRDSWVALDQAGEIVAWTYLENLHGGPREFVEVYAWPGRGEPAQRHLLDLSLRRAAERAAERGVDQPTVRAGAIPSETGWIAVLREAGFEFVKRYARMTRSLDGVGPVPPPPPPGVEIRLVRSDDDADLRQFHSIMDTAFRDTPDYQPIDYDGWRQRLAALPSIAWDEWFVATVDGVPAGVLQSSDQALADQEGWIKILAVRREHRRRGVGAALLATAFATYAAKGRTAAGLGVDLANPTQAHRLYYGVGMRAAYESDIFERPVAVGQDSGDSLRVGRARRAAT